MPICAGTYYWHDSSYLKNTLTTPGRENPHLKVVHMIGPNGCFFQEISLAAGLHFQEKSLATGAKVFHFPLDAGIDFVILI